MSSKQSEAKLHTVKCVNITKHPGSDRLQHDLKSEFQSRGVEQSDKIFHIMLRAKRGLYRNSKPEFGVPAGFSLVDDLKQAGLKDMAKKAEDGRYTDTVVF